MRETEMEIDGLRVTVVRKAIQSMNLYVKAPDGRIRVSAPVRTSDRAVRAFVHAHLSWIAAQQEVMRRRYVARRWETGETVFVFGTPHTLAVCADPQKKRWGVRQDGNRLLLIVPENSTDSQREQMYQRWQRTQLRAAVSGLLAEWEPALGVHAAEWHIKRMKTKWGSCNYRAHRIWLNLSLAEQSMECVEYVVVHELCHLLEPSHNERFWALMTQFLPDWQQRRTTLNQKQETR